MKLKVNLHITERCNYRCRHCFSHFYTKKELALEDWCKIADNFIGNMKIQQFNIAGGEPLLVSYLPKLVDYVNNPSLNTLCFEEEACLIVD